MNEKAISATSVLLLKSFTFFITIIAITFVAVPIPLLWVADNLLSFDIGPFRFIGLIAVVVGLALMSELAAAFAVYGRGTPAPFDPPRHLVVCGPYRYLRNPGYLGAVTALMGESLLVQSGVVFLLAVFAACFFHLFVVYYEEPSLKRRFGKEYEDYVQRVSRWLPKLQHT